MSMTRLGLERLPGGTYTHWKAPPCHGTPIPDLVRILASQARQHAVEVAGHADPSIPGGSLTMIAKPKNDGTHHHRRPATGGENLPLVLLIGGIIHKARQERPHG